MALTEVDFVARADGWFEIRSLSPSACLSRFLLQRGFCFDDWLEAALATERLQPRPDDEQKANRATTYLLNGDAANLVQTVVQVMEYFDGPGQPAEELRRLRTRITQWIDDAGTLSDYLLAYGDMELRELLADEARNSPDVWTAEVLAVDSRPALEVVLERLRRRSNGATETAGNDDLETRPASALAESLRKSQSRVRQREVG